MGIIQSVKATGAKAVDKVKSIPTKKKVAAAVTAAAIIGATAYAYTKGKALPADQFTLREGQTKPGVLQTITKGYAEIGKAVVNKAKSAKDAVVNLFGKNNAQTEAAEEVAEAAGEAASKAGDAVTEAAGTVGEAVTEATGK